MSAAPEQADHQAASASGEQRSSIVGQVAARGSGLPVPGAVVTFFLEGAAYDVLTDAGGAFRFEAPRPGTYELRRIAAEGFAPYETERGRSDLRFVARPGATVDGVHLELEPLMRCAGKVTRDGQPAPGVRVQCNRRDLVRGEAVTNGHGEFEVWCAQWHVLHVPGEMVFDMIGERPDCDWNVDLKRDALPGFSEGSDLRFRTLSGRVVDEQGQPIEHVWVWCDEVGEPSIRRLLLGVSGRTLGPTDETGTFQCAVVEGRAMRALVAGVPASEQRYPAGVDHVTLVISAAGRIRGLVRDFDGRPVRAFVITAKTGLGQHYRRAFVSTEGRFDLDGVVAGLYEVAAVTPGLPPSLDTEVVVDPGGDAEVTLTLQEGPTVQGLVLDASTGRPISGARVSRPIDRRWTGPPELPQALSLPGPAVTGADGRFTMNRIATTEAALFHVSAPGYHDEALEIGELEEVTVELEPLPVDGAAWP